MDVDRSPAGRPDPATSVAGYLRARPAGSRVFLEHRMACVGCSLAEFDTLADAAREYRLPLEPFLDRLAAIGPADAAPSRPDVGDRA